MSNTFGLTHVKNIIAVSSCKGGVGKSTMAANIAWELSKRNLSVGLLDADIHGPSLPALFNMHNVEIYSDEFKQIIPIEHEGLKLMSFGFLLGDAPAVMRGPIVTRYIQQMLLQVAWGNLDYLIIDMPPGTGDIQLTITQSARLTGAVIVTTPQTLSLVDVARGIIMFEKVNVPILGIIENMSYFLCDQCDKKHYIFGSGKLQERFGVRTLAEVPIQKGMIGNFRHYVANAYVQNAVDGILDAVVNKMSANQGVPKINFDAKQIHLSWDNGRELTVNNRDLRLSCHCALCVDEINGKQLFDPSKIPTDVAPEAIAPLGNYALSITWNDGHSSGIYPYAMLQPAS